MSDNDGVKPVDVDVNDDLDTFADEFFGKAKSETVEKEEEVDVDNDEDTVDLPEAEAEEEDNAEPEEEDDESEPEDQPKQKNRKSAKDRINELVADRKALEKRLADMEAKLARAEPPEPKQEKTPVAAVTEDAPHPDAVNDKDELIYPLGEFDPKYIADLTRFTIRQENAAFKAEQAQKDAETKAKDKQESLVSAWEVKLEDTEKEIPDLRTKLVSLETTLGDLDPDYGVYLAETIMTMERGPEVLYYLASNVSEAKKIVASGAVAATIALGRLEGQLSNKTNEKESNKKVSKAPQPPVTTRGTGVTKTTAPDTDDLDAFERSFFKRRK